jgi:hypothetical protein
MNERIQELAQQAEMSANKGDHVDVKLMMEKFAQLIVQECAQGLRDYAKFLHEEYPHEYDDLTAENCAVIIEEQFGLWDKVYKVGLDNK